MVRGHAKEQAQERNAARQAKAKNAGSQFQARKAGLKFQCPLCRLEVSNYISMTQHYESKHSKETCPPEEGCAKT
eukprot:NODE_23011_length_684_cov_5.809695.p2 GENE.NODE_23011_length_684_cov_5.809695~~NODE_23011_length_684_cov_5.809695.p2  ORF type:complete len:75 (+),score=21.78 NODE_23011_length_684_cov_5.809695:90-314(+)